LRDKKKPYEIPKYEEREFVVSLLQVCQSLWSEIQYFVEYEILTWYRAPNEGEQADGIVFGEHKKSEVTIVVHTLPKEGLGYAISQADPRVNVTLISHFLMVGQMMRENSFAREWVIAEKKKFTEAGELLRALARRFQKEVFLQGLQKIVDEHGGPVTGVCGPIRFSTLFGMGRIQVRLDFGNLFLNIIGDDSESCKHDPRMGVTELQATVPQAKLIVDQITDAWSKVQPEHRIDAFKIKLG
jgi:hypothetical protein